MCSISGLSTTKQKGFTMCKTTTICLMAMGLLMMIAGFVELFSNGSPFWIFMLSFVGLITFWLPTIMINFESSTK